MNDETELLKRRRDELWAKLWNRMYALSLNERRPFVLPT